MSFDRRIFVLALSSGAAATAIALVLLWTGDFTPRVRWTFSAAAVLPWLGCAFAARERVVYTLQTMANLLAALRDGDYSVRARAARGGALKELVSELNALGTSLRLQRQESMEATALLRKVMDEIDVCVFTFDEQRRLRRVNRAGERLLGAPVERLLGSPAEELGLAEYLEGAHPRTLQRRLPEGERAFEVRRGVLREDGVPHQLLVLSDLSRALREEERLVWQRLIRVLGHELNNSLTPIKSISQSLTAALRGPDLPPDFREDALRGLEVIGARAEALTRFLQAYARLSRLPAPTKGPVDVDAWVRRAVALETRAAVRLVPGPSLVLQGDEAQLDQLLINVLRNAAEAALSTGGGVEVGWTRTGSHLEVRVRDEGPGLPPSANVFVPFFTTKPAGSGIGLVLSRQIAEAHGGSLTLQNRGDSPGCEARLRLPLAA
ncbi:MAG TPA: ATP-binding protein [Candidatus Polarisedimenticolaceae bacterium]|nr:ATP-binding protein [Candidatus Polarisedimenticolaceae bacterium]